MTREEAIEFIKNIIGEESGRCIGKEGFYAELIGYHIEALKMAIQALSQEPTKREIEREYLFQSLCEDFKKLQAENDDLRKRLEQEPCDDAISREDAIHDVIADLEAVIGCVKADLRRLPSVTQKGDVKNV